MVVGVLEVLGGFRGCREVVNGLQSFRVLEILRGFRGCREVACEWVGCRGF